MVNKDYLVIKDMDIAPNLLWKMKVLEDYIEDFFQMFIDSFFIQVLEFIYMRIVRKLVDMSGINYLKNKWKTQMM